MKVRKLNLAAGLAGISQHWTPHIAGKVNDTHLKLVKLRGDFVWHCHAEQDEAFLVLKGQLDIELRDKVVTLNEGELVVVPRSVEHRPVCREECHVLLIEPVGTLNTGDTADPRRLEHPPRL